MVELCCSQDAKTWVDEPGHPGRFKPAYKGVKLLSAYAHIWAAGVWTGEGAGGGKT